MSNEYIYLVASAICFLVAGGALLFLFWYISGWEKYDRITFVLVMAIGLLFHLIYNLHLRQKRLRKDLEDIKNRLDGRK
jgi:hypothetical protein